LTMNASPSDFLPHRPPFLFLEKIVELLPGLSGRAISSPSLCSQIFLLECVAQLAGCIVVEEKDEGGFLASIESAEFLSREIPEREMLEVTARVTRNFGRLHMVTGEVRDASGNLLSVNLTIGTGKI